jgi:hypothetical protein
LYLEFWAITDGLWFLGYITPIVAPKPSVEQVAGASHSTVGKIGSHTILWALLRDSAMRLHV